MRLSPILTLVASLLVAGLLWLVAPVMVGRPLKPWELLGVAIIAFAVLVWWRGRRLRHERRELESMRDSALW